MAANAWHYIKLGLAEMREVFPKLPERKREPGARRRMPPDLPAALALLALMAAYATVVALALSPAYIDLGDGNYLYTASRMADGLTIYRDFLSPQPPMHLVVGSWLIRLGRLWGQPLMTVRVFSILLRLAAIGWVFLLARRVTQSAWGGCIAAAVMAVLPIGFWWNMGYQSEHQEIFYLLGALVFLLPHRALPMVLAGAMTALAVLTNMTAAPYAFACLVYLVVRCRWRLLVCFAAPLAAIVALVAGYYEIRTGAYLENVIFNQVGSYPQGDAFWPYVWGKLSGQGMKILALEGGWIALGLLGLALYNRTDMRREREFLVWYALVLLLSVVYVTKGGTMDYIFTIGEPMVAVFAAHFLAHFFYPSTFRRFFRRPLWNDTSSVPQFLFIAFLFIVVAAPGMHFIALTLRQETYEQPAEGVERVAYFIRKHSKPGDRILAPPYYAFLTDRLLVEEYSELFLWGMKYRNERAQGIAGAGVMKVRAIEKALKEKAIPIVVADTGNALILSTPEIRNAVAEHYEPLLDKPYRTLNFRIQIFVPAQGRKD